MAARKRKSSGNGRKGGNKGIIGIITGVVSFIVITALVVGFLRANNLTDAQSVVDASRASVNPMQAFSNKIAAKFDELLKCNILKNSDCIQKPSGGLQDPGNIVQAPAKPGNADGSMSSTGGNATGSVGGNDGTASADSNGGQQAKPASDLESKLDQITVADAQKTEYSRADYPHWVIQSGKCDTRETVLANAGFASDTRTCKAGPKAGFTYTEPYSGKQVSDPSKLDIDHVIPLGYADAHGGHEWDKSKKQQFANDMSQLVAADASANRKKGDKGPSEWMPSNKAYTCEYSTIWIDTALKYGVSITDADKNALKTGIQSCK